MPTKKEMLETKTKAELLALAEQAGVTTVKKSMNKGDMVEALSRTTKVKKADL
ncbi:MAG: hypothetical protein ACLFVU_05620 [Phycisphaerae bacterium]